MSEQEIEKIIHTVNVYNHEDNVSELFLRHFLLAEQKIEAMAEIRLRKRENE